MLKILGVLFAIVAIFFGVAAMQPEDFTLTRSITVNAPAPAIFNLVNDFHNWENWSPWAKMDLSMKKTFEGPSAGEGAAYIWSGNGKVGEGKMTLTKSIPSELVQIQLDFLRPMKCTNMSEFKFKSEGQSTLVTWTMTGKNNLIAKAIHLIANMDKLVGGDFERGLSQLKALAESNTK